jgi:uncharacterized membrane protein
MRGLKIFLLLLPIFAAIDLLWLGVIMKSFYQQELGDLARRNGAALAPRWAPAAAVYLLIPAGIMLFVWPQIRPNAPTWHAFAWGALYGLVVYGVYDSTNWAVLEKWTARMTFADIAWGCTLCGLSAIAVQAIDRWLGPT